MIQGLIAQLFTSILQKCLFFFPGPHRQDGKRGRWRQEQRGCWLELETGTGICLHLKYQPGPKTHPKTKRSQSSQPPTNNPCFRRHPALQGHTFPNKFPSYSPEITIPVTHRNAQTCAALIPRNLHQSAQSKEPTPPLRFKMRHRAYPGITTHNSRLCPISPLKKPCNKFTFNIHPLSGTVNE